MASAERKIKRILKNNYDVSSGVYTAVDPKIRMQLNEGGRYTPIFSGDEAPETFKKLLAVDMMSDESENETQVSKKLFSQIPNIKNDAILGYYTDLYVGHVLEGDFRSIGSSGGFGTWILAELLNQKKIDGVIHAHQIDPRKNEGKLFRYGISRSLQEVKKGAKSRYYPMELSEVLKIVKQQPGRYAVTGIPEFITELRLLASIDPVIKERIKFMIGLVCGHQKTATYAEALAWQHGIKPGDLHSVDFRVKQPTSSAIDYLHQFTGLVNGKKTTLTKTHTELFAENWAAGFFKAKFSDFTDNTFAETADIVLGDAWLPQYNADGMGNNIIIVRDQELSKLLKKAIKTEQVKLEPVSDQTIKDSQLGLIHHTRDELPYRLFRQKRRGKWVPTKRSKPSGRLRFLRKRVQNIRYKIATSSHKVYADAVARDDWAYFESRMEPLIRRYNFLYRLIALQSAGFMASFRRRLRLRTRIKNVVVRTKRKTRIRTRIKEALRSMRNWWTRRNFRRADGAIVTLTGYYNYGNIIQRYALQEFLKQHGYNFVCYARESLYNDMGEADSERLADTKDFVQQYIWRKPFDAKDSFPVYLVGSDQVWRNWSYENEKTELGYYFLDFVRSSRSKRIAYAASFGVDNLKDALVSTEFTEYAHPFVKKFDAISVREESGKTILKDTWNISSQQVIDPTMLLTTRDYDQLIDNSSFKLKSAKQAFAYILAPSDNKAIIIDKAAYATKYNVDILEAYTAKKLIPVEQWLRNFRDAELVVTDSFHGVVFSILNNTPFIAIENELGGVTRLTTLLKQFGLQDRKVAEKDANMFNYKKLTAIDWKAVNITLDSLRTESGAWLLDAINQPHQNGRA